LVDAADIDAATDTTRIGRAEASCTQAAKSAGSKTGSA
jgi:hypothetical protein